MLSVLPSLGSLGIADHRQRSEQGFSQWLWSLLLAKRFASNIRRTYGNFQDQSFTGIDTSNVNKHAC